MNNIGIGRILAAASTLAVIGTLLGPAPEQASATVYHTFEIENYTELELSLASTYQPDNNGWGTPPPYSVSMGERRHFSVMYWWGYFDLSYVSYTFVDTDGSTQYLSLKTYRDPSSDWSTCSTTSKNFVCTVLPWTRDYNTRFVLNLRYPMKTEIDGDKDFDKWLRILDSLCVHESIATCTRVYSQWIITLGNLKYQLFSPYVDDLPIALRGQPYRGTVASVFFGKPGFAIEVTELPQSLVYDSRYDVIVGTPTAPAGYTKPFITVSFRGTVVTSGRLDLRIEQPPSPSISTSALRDATVGKPYAQFIATDLAGSSRSGSTMSAAGLPPGMYLDANLWGIGGTPVTAGTYNVVLTLNTSSGATAKITLPLVVKTATTQ